MKAGCHVCFASVVSAVVCFFPAGASAMVFPGADWQTATPESQGVDSTKLNAAVSYLQSNSGGDGVRELVIIRNGYMIHSGNNIDKQHGIWSATKSFTSTVLGLLIDDGKCTLSTRAKDYLSSMTATYPDVNLKHFTTMTSGYVAVGDIPATGYTHGPSATWWDPDPTPLFTPPGSKYAYWDSAMNQFANALTQIAGEPIENLFKRRIADPIQMDRAKWDWGDFGTIGGYVVNGGSGNGNRHMFISAREMARFGHLFLNRGNWDGTQLLSASWVDAAGSVQVPASTPLGDPVRSAIYGPGVYSYNWWVNGLKSNGERKWPGLPTSTYAASGYNNNDMFVIPDWSMVIVRLGLDQGDFLMTDTVYGTFLNKVGEAITGGAVNPPVITSPAPGADLVEGSTITLEGTGDGTLSWSYDANSDGEAEIAIGTGSPCSFVVPTGVADPRTITIFLTGDGGKASVDCNIISGANRPPTVSLTATPASGAPPLAVSFDAGSSDPDGDTLAHEWDFDYDGATFTVDQSTGATATASHPYDTAGTYTAAVRVSDGTDTVIDTVTVTATVPGAITIECEDMTLVDYNIESAEGYIAVDYQNVITGTATTTFSGDTARYRIEVIIVKEDDGQPTLDVYVAGALVDTISYALGSSARDPETVSVGEVDLASGDEIELVGTLQGGAAARVDKIILTPTGPANSAPTVNLSATPASGEAPLEVSFDAGSSDPDSDPLTHEWDFDYDGATFTVDGSTGATATTTYTYNTAGTYTAAVRVSDGTETVVDAVAITVTSAGNTPPSASVISPADGTEYAPGSTITYSGGAADAEDGVLSGSSLAWEVDRVGDGQPAEHTSTGVSGSYVFPSGISSRTEYRVRLTATDSGGLTDTVELSVFVDPAATPNDPPTVALSADPASGEAPLAVSFDAGSSDPDGDALTHEWDFDYDGATFTVAGSTGATATTDHTYDADGTFTAAVRVSDGNGHTEIDTVSITVGASADDSSGNSFGCTPPGSAPPSSGILAFALAVAVSVAHGRARRARSLAGRSA